MFAPITLPFGAKMLFNTVKLKPGVSFDDVEVSVAEMCSVVKETYGGDKGGFISSSSRDSCLKEVRSGAPPQAMNTTRSSPTGARSRNTKDRTPTRSSPPSSRR